MSFVNSLPYISNPIEEFRDFKFGSWEKDIYPKYKGGINKGEAQFFADIIVSKNLKKILDLGVGGGLELAGILPELKRKNYEIETCEANEIDESFIAQALSLFYNSKLNVLIHKSNWIDLPYALPTFTNKFNFAFLTGNSLTYIGGGSREYTKKAQQSIVSRFASLIEPGGYLFIDTRNYDYIKSLMNLKPKQVLENFQFEKKPYYQGFPDPILVFPAYISETVVVLHYYDKERKVWSKLDLYPIYDADMREILSQYFKIEEVYYDFQEGKKEKSLFIQYLARRK